jgi:hypothetical protein
MLGLYASLVWVLTLVDLRSHGACNGIATGVSIDGDSASWVGTTSIGSG